MTRKCSLSIIFISLCALVQFVHCHSKLRTLSNGVMMFKRKENTTTKSISDTSDAGDNEMKTLPFGWDTSGKYFASVWDNKGKGTYTAKGDNEGKYEFKWQSIDDAIVGKGFRTGTKDRVIKYDGQFEVTGNGAYLALYGWSVGNQCVEYYVVDNWGQYPPCGSDTKGTFESDGDTYTICTVSMQGPCVDGSGQNHMQYWSKRKTKRSSGTITFANHVSAWEKAGMVLGTLSSPQLLAVEAYADSSGSATITISASGGGGNNTDSTSSTAAGGGNGTDTTSPNSQGSISNEKDTTSPTSQGGITSNDTNTTSTAAQGGSVDSSGTTSNDNSGDDDSSKDTTGNGNNDANPDASKDSSKDANEASNGQASDASQDYSGDDYSGDASKDPSKDPNEASNGQTSDASQGLSGDDSGDNFDDKSDDDTDDYGKDDSSTDDKDDSSADDKSDATPNGDPTSAKPNTTDASPPKDTGKDQPIVPQLCNTVGLKDADKNAGINDQPPSSNNKTTPSRSQHDLDRPSSQGPEFSKHSHSLKRRTTTSHHHNFIKKRSGKSDSTKKPKAKKKPKKSRYIGYEENSVKEQGITEYNILPSNTSSSSSRSTTTSSDSTSNLTNGSSSQNSTNKTPPSAPPTSSTNGKASPPKVNSAGNISDTPEDMPAVGNLDTMKYGWDDSGNLFASVWDDKKGGTYTAKSDNDATYSITWNGVDDIVIGKGWINGTIDRIVEYNGTFNVTGNGAYLSFYGWSTNDCVEYYVTESWGIYKPCFGQSKGTFESDGDLYTACIVSRSSQCIDGSDGFRQFWSVRKTKRTSGIITFANHVKAWESYGMKLGSLNKPQIMAVEAYAGSFGSATVTVEGISSKILSGNGIPNKDRIIKNQTRSFIY